MNPLSPLRKLWGSYVPLWVWSALLVMALAVDACSVLFTSSRKLVLPNAYGAAPFYWLLGVALFSTALYPYLAGTARKRVVRLILSACAAAVAVWVIYIATILFHVLVGGEL